MTRPDGIIPRGARDRRFRHACPCRPGGFTLVELLVVVAIIALLAAILMPSMRRVNELTRRAVCASNLHQTQLSHLAWAQARDGHYVEGQPVYVNQGHYACWWRNRTPPASHADYGAYTKHGALVHQRYLDSGKVFYCPSWRFPAVQYKTHGPSVYPGYQGGGWFEKPSDVPAGQVWMQTSYHYNCTYSAVADPKVSQMRSARTYDPGYLPLIADAFSDPSRGIDWHHVEGYNVLQLDGATYFYRDPANEIRDLNGGATYHSGTAMYEVHQVHAWRILTRE